MKRRDFLLALTGSVAVAQNVTASAHPTPATVSVDAFKHAIQTTPTAAFPVQRIKAHPIQNDANWQVTVSGLMDGNHQPITLQTLQTLPAVDTLRTIECIGNPAGGTMIGNAHWRGARAVDVLAGWAIPKKTTHAKFTAADGYQTAVSLDALQHPDTLFAYAMNHQPLTPEHGYPVRLLVVGTYGQKMVKSIKHIDFIDHIFKGYWESRGWSDDATVQTHAMIFPPQTEVFADETLTLRGIAFAGLRAIDRVEVRIDGGAWIAADLVKPDSPLAWTQWYLDWTPAHTGAYTLEVRATDEQGTTQSHEGQAPINAAFPNGNTHRHQITVTVI